jgi:ferredoxin-type protein NapF
MTGRLRIIRRVVQIAALGFFVYLFVRTSVAAVQRVPVDLFLRVDPLAAISAMIAQRRFALDLALWALPLLALTLVMGRVFCGWLCPLGTTIDGSDALFFRRRPRSPAAHERLRAWKFYVLIAVAVAALVGAQLAFWVDPIPLLVRSLTLGVLAPVHWLLGQLASVAPGLRRVESLGDFLAAPLHYRMNWAALAIFVGVLSLGALSRRFWCRYLCPLGALLGLIGRWALVRKYVSADSCVKCMRCLPACDMGAISDDPTQYSGYECIDCFGCEAVCPEAAISLRASAAAGGRSGRVDLSRRRLVQAAAFGAVGAVMMKTELGARPTSSVHEPPVKVWDPQLLRPPGAAGEDRFVAACVRCGECMGVCPTNGLQPALGEAGLEGFWTPVLVPRVGPCAADCTACGQVCPTDALSPFTVEEKSWIYLGTAAIDRSTCLVWAHDRQCLVCDEYCTYDAVYWKQDEQGRRVPYVDEYRCVGCGLCESACPVQPLAAIRVFSGGDKREWPRERQRQWFERGKAISRELRKGEVPAPSTYPVQPPPTEGR